MAIAAVAHIYVFPTEPYRFLPAPEHGKVTVETKAKLKVGEDAGGKPAIVEQTEMRVEVPGTSITESVQDVVLGGGEHVSFLTPCYNCTVLSSSFVLCLYKSTV